MCNSRGFHLQQHGYNQPPMGQEYTTHVPKKQTMNLFTLQIYGDWNINVFDQHVQWPSLLEKYIYIYTMVFHSQFFTNPVIPMGLGAAQKDWLCSNIDWHRPMHVG